MRNVYATILSAILFMPFTSPAQLSQMWFADYQHTATGAFSNEGKRTVMDAAGNIYTVSDVTSDLDPSGVVTGATFHYTVLLKYDASGQLLASRNILVNNHATTGPNLIGAFGLDIDANGFIYVGYVNYNTITNYNANIAKYTSDLTRLWNYNFNPAGIEEGVQIKISPNGNVYGLIKSTNGTNIQYHIIKGDSNIVSSTAVYSFATNLEFISDFLVDEFGDFYVTGYKIILSAKNALTMGIKQTGTLKWIKTYNGGTIIRDDSGNKIVKGQGNELFVVGSSDRGIPNNNDLMVLKYIRTNGRFDWVTFIDNASKVDLGIHIKVYNPYNLYTASVSGTNQVIVDRIETRTGVHSGRRVYEPVPADPHSAIQSVSIADMKVSPNNNIYLTGTVRAIDLSGQTFSAYYLTNFIPVTSRFPLNAAFKIDIEEPVDGNFQTSYTSIGMSIDFSTNNLFLLLDRFETFTSHATEQVRLLGYNSPSILKNENNSLSGNQNNSIENFSVYPNPATDFINISIGKGVTSIEISDVTGKIVKSISVVNEGSSLINIADMESGVYIVTTHNSSGLSDTTKLIKY